MSIELPTDQTHRQVTDADLADTFGPSWLLVVDTVRTVAAATPEQIRALDAAWDAAWDAARAAARDAARDAARAAARDAAWAAVRDAARDARAATWAAAWVAAWAAARAATWVAAVIDLVGVHGLTADHVRILTAPWREVFPDSALTAAVNALEQP